MLASIHLRIHALVPIFILTPALYFHAEADVSGASQVISAPLSTTQVILTPESPPTGHIVNAVEEVNYTINHKPHHVHYVDGYPTGVNVYPYRTNAHYYYEHGYNGYGGVGDGWHHHNGWNRHNGHHDGYHHDGQHHHHGSHKGHHSSHHSGHHGGGHHK